MKPQLVADLARGEAVAKVMAAFVFPTRKVQDVNSDGNAEHLEVLLAYKLDSETFTPIGGKAKPGESLTDCVRREAFEESGLILGRLQLLSWNESDDWFALLFTAEAQNPEDALNREPTKHESVTWFNQQSYPSNLFSQAEVYCLEVLFGERFPGELTENYVKA